MFRVDERRERRLRRVVPFAGRRVTAGVLRGGDDLEIAALQLVIQFLPAWQIESAPSPGGPRDHQHLPAAEAVEMHWSAGAIRHREIRCDSRGEAAAERLDFAEAPDV